MLMLAHPRDKSTCIITLVILYSLLFIICTQRIREVQCNSHVVKFQFMCVSERLCVCKSDFVCMCICVCLNVYM